jgi:hypothetical protein
MNKINYRSHFRGIVVPVILLFQLLPLSAQDEVKDTVSAAKLKEIQSIFYHDRANAQHWWYGWLAGYSAATVGQGIVYFSTQKTTTRQDMALGSATTLLGALAQLFTPLVPSNSSPRDLKNISDVELNNPGKYEENLKELSLREKNGRSWKMHAVTGVVNLGSGLITWRGFHRTFKDGVINFALNTVITEAQIWTQPVRAVKDYKNYSEKYYSGLPITSRKPEKEWLVQVYPGGFSLVLSF